jgi:hypothetical protein
LQKLAATLDAPLQCKIHVHTAVNSIPALSIMQIHEYILVHGDIRVKTKVNVAGEEMELETFVDNEHEEGAVKHSTADFAKRGSFLVMRDNMKARVSQPSAETLPCF